MERVWEYMAIAISVAMGAATLSAMPEMAIADKPQTQITITVDFEAETVEVERNEVVPEVRVNQFLSVYELGSLDNRPLDLSATLPDGKPKYFPATVTIPPPPPEEGEEPGDPEYRTIETIAELASYLDEHFADDDAQPTNFVWAGNAYQRSILTREKTVPPAIRFGIASAAAATTLMTDWMQLVDAGGERIEFDKTTIVTFADGTATTGIAATAIYMNKLFAVEPFEVEVGGRKFQFPGASNWAYAPNANYEDGTTKVWTRSALGKHLPITPDELSVRN